MTLRSLLVGSVAIAAIAGISPILPTAINPVTQAQAAISASASFAVFYDKLAPYGQWVNFHNAYVFVPDNLPDNWRPYTVGHWAASRQYGWIWISDEPFGWATYHYGRWGYDEEIGWYWIPGTIWGPAWVTWRASADDVVWAPLPPSGGDEVAVAVDVNAIPEDYWVAVPTARFLEPNLAVVIIIDRNEHRRVFASAQPLGSVKIVNNIVVNNVIKVKDIEEKTNTKVKMVNVTKTNELSKPEVSGENVTAFTGKIEARKDEKPSNVADVNTLKQGKKKIEQGQQAPQQNQPGVTTGEQQPPQGKKKKIEQGQQAPQQNQPGVTTGEQQQPEGQAPNGGMKKKKPGYANNPPSGNQPNANGQQNQQQQAETPDLQKKKRKLNGNESGTNALQAPNQNGGDQGQAPKLNRPPVIENQNQPQMNQGNEPQGQKKGLQCNPKLNPNCQASP